MRQARRRNGENGRDSAIAAGRTGPRAGRARRTARVSGATTGLPAHLSPRKRPRQHRAHATVEAVLQAAVELLASQSYADVSTNRIAARAGISIGSLYQYFPNKDAIVVALFERHLQDVEAVVAGALGTLRDPSVPIRRGIHRLLESLAALHDANPMLAHAADPRGDGAHAGEALLRRREERFRTELAALLRTRPDVRRGDHLLMATLLVEIVEALSRLLMHGGASGFSRDVTFAEATEAICRYVERRPAV
jgi:AcrR family transcriptional regulator